MLGLLSAKKGRGDPWRSHGQPCRGVPQLPVHKFGVLRHPYFSTPTGNFKKNGKQVAAQVKKPKSGPKRETECFYCKGTVHWKRNCPKYLADKKDGKVNKGICDIHVTDVYLTNARSSTWVFDTGSVANICNSK